MKAKILNNLSPEPNLVVPTILRIPKEVNEILNIETAINLGNKSKVKLIFYSSSSTTRDQWFQILKISNHNSIFRDRLMKDLHNEVLGGSISELPALKNIPIQLETTNNENFNNTEKGLFPKSSNNVQKTVSGRNQINNHSPLKKLNYNNTAIYKISPEHSAKQKFTPEKFVITQQMLRGDVSQESLLKSPNEVSSKVTASYEKVIPAIERPNSNDLLQSLSIKKESNKAVEVSIKKLNLEKVQNYQQLCGTDSENKQRSQYSYRNKNSKDAEANFNWWKAIEEAKSYKDFQANKSSFVQKSSYTPRGETPKPGDWGMSDAEKKVYGDRTPKDYTKVNLLGRGGWAIVWLAKNLLTEKIVAIKQFPKNQGSVGSAKVEELIFSNLNSKSNLNHEGSESISHLLETIDENKDLWLVYEVGGDSLSKVKT